MRFELPFSFYSAIDFPRRDCLLLYQATRYDNEGFAAKEVQHAVLNPLLGGPELVDAIG